MTKHALTVWLCEKPVGTLKLNSGSMTFLYEHASRALSLSMPIQDAAYKNRACEAFFGALLPDGTVTKEKIARVLGLNSNSNFSLLEKIGFDCAGAVSLRSPDEQYAQEEWFQLNGTVVNDDDLYSLLVELPTRPLFAGIDGLRVSLGGVQDKAALCLIDGKLCIPGPNVPTTHILKPRIRGIRDSVINEYFCMSLSRKAGIDAPRVEIKKNRDLEFILIERFDREISAGTIRRIHQEDFCQALGIVSTKKYQADGGPTLKNCFDLLERTSVPVLDKRELLKRVIFNYIVSNTDCHGKNFSLLHVSEDNIKLAPAYDILSSLLDPQLTTKFAMTIGGEWETRRISREHWRKFCNSIEVTLPAFKSTAQELIRAIDVNALEVSNDLKKSGFLNDTVDELSNIVRSRALELIESIREI